MKEATILKISLVTTIIGLFLLFYIGLQPLAETSAEDLLEKTEGAVKFTGQVKGVSRAEGVTFVKVVQPVETTVVVFGNTINLSQGDTIEIIGDLDQFNGQKEVIARRIRMVT
ncbi:MAG TPA: hypothetical protein VJB08_03500 [Candidatus Nanoarchaeia archaeon]|nr:hypothetical protein [Candidatus Nanoarchaeia archaeon]